MGTTFHPHITIDSFLKKRSLKHYFRNKDGEDLSDLEARQMLVGELQKGKTYFCGCDNPDQEGKCAGHPS